MYGDKPARRTVLATVGALCSGTLAGCSGSDTTAPESNGNEDTIDSQDSNPGSNNSTDQQSKESDTQQSEDYPTEEPESQDEETIIRVIENSEEAYAIKFDDMQYINDEDLVAPDKNEIRNYEQALYEALNSDLVGDVESMWFTLGEDDGSIQMIPNIENNEWSPEWSTTGFSDEFEDPGRTGAEENHELAKSEYGDFISERLDGDGVVNHAGEIPDYAREALESGWQAQ